MGRTWRLETGREDGEDNGVRGGGKRMGSSGRWGGGEIVCMWGRRRKGKGGQ